MSVRSTPARTAIIEAARRQVASGEVLSVAGIARGASVSRQTVHAHFGGLRGIRAALAQEGLIELAPDEAASTRERLLDAAERLLRQPGGGLITIEAIAAEAGMTKGAAYHHFADRGEILRAVTKRVSPVDELVGKLGPMDGTLRDGLIAIASAYYQAMRSRADLIRNLAANSSRDPELAEVVMGEIVGQGSPLMLGWLNEQMARGALRPVDPSLIVQALFGPVFLLIVLGPRFLDRLAAVGVKPAIDNVEEYVDMILEGIAAQSGGGA